MEQYLLIRIAELKESIRMMPHGNSVVQFGINELEQALNKYRELNK